MAKKAVSHPKVAPKAPEPAEDDPSKPHMIGYARVSMNDQNNQRQIDELVAFGVDPRDIYTDKASGRDMKRPGWAACWKDLRGPQFPGGPGDLLVIHSIDRLGRDLIEVVKTVQDLHKKGCELKVLSMDIDTRTPTGRLIFAIVAAMAQWERELIVERTQHGLAKARERGIVGGRRPKITDAQVREAVKRIKAGEDAATVAAEYGVSRQAIYKRERLLQDAKEAKKHQRAMSLAIRVVRVTRAVLEEEHGC